MRKTSAFLLLGLLTSLPAQQTPTAKTTTATTISTVPRLVRVSSTFKPADSQPAAGMEGVTLSIYKDEKGGTALWQETQNVSVDSEGRYTVLLGLTHTDGVPAELFSSGEPRWLGVQFQRPGEAEQARVLMASVPYALKAVDAETLGGLPASAYQLAPASLAGAPAASSPAMGNAKTTGLSPKVTSGTAGYLGMFSNTTDLTNSVMFQNGAKIGLGTTAPADYFHVQFSDTSGGYTGYAVQNLGSGAASYSGMLFYDQNGAVAQFQGFNNSTHEYRVNNVASSGSINFMLKTVSKLQVRSDGDVDIPGSIRKSGNLFLHNLGSGNTSVGLFAIPAGSTGYSNTAVGYASLFSNTNGAENTAVGSYALDQNSTGSWNTGIGNGALQLNATGVSNTAVGQVALQANTASFNTATGVGALMGNTSGTDNTANGYLVLQNNITGSYNTGNGAFALQHSNADNNTALGYNTLSSNTTGTYNTAVGLDALSSNNTGSTNTALGVLAGYNIAGSDNIDIGNAGTSTDNGVIRIGASGTQTQFFAAGIRGVQVGAQNGVEVIIDTNGQLGTTNSSRRFKEDIQNMGEASGNLMRLRPVTYRYKQPYLDGSKPVDYGLIAEEVEEIYPDLVAKSADGQIETVQYQKLTPMLLNEVQKLRRDAQEQKETMSQLMEEITALKKAMQTSASKSAMEAPVH